MNAPQPPDHQPPRYAAPPARPNESDPDATGPIHTVTPSILGDQPWWTLFETPPPPPRRNRTPMLLAGAGVALLAVIVGCLALRLTRPAGTTGPADAEQTTSSPAAASTTTPSSDDTAVAQLLRHLPAGYPQDACQPTTAPAGALAAVHCDKTTEGNGPSAATYTLIRDKAALDSAFNDVLATSRAVTCPGNIQSPGPWRRTTSLQNVSGTLLCAFQDAVPTLAWTDDTRLVLSVVHADPQPQALDQLYTWWVEPFVIANRISAR